MRREFGAAMMVFGVLAIVALAVFYIIIPNLPQFNTELRIGDGVFQAKVASNDQDRAKWANSMTNLSPSQVLLMAYPNEDKWAVDTNDIKTPIDIIWLNKNKKVVHIVEGVSPESVQKIYASNLDAMYIIEMSAGLVEGRTNQPDSVADFQINTADIK